MKKMRVYENLRRYLDRTLGVSCYSKIANLLLKKFVDSNKPTTWQQISFSELKEFGICPSKDYKNLTIWRNHMIDKGILICMASRDDFGDPIPNPNANLFKFGNKIKKYIELALVESASIYERIDSKADQVDMNILTDKIATLEQNVDDLSLKFDNLTHLVMRLNPPDNDERRKIIAENVNDAELCEKLLQEEEFRRQMQQMEDGASVH